MDVFIKTADGWKSFASLGITITGGIESAMCAASLRNVYTNEWAEEEGLDVDLSDVKSGSKSVTLSVAYSNEDARVSLIRMFLESLYNDFRWGEDETHYVRTFRWRFASESASQYSAVHTAKLTFVDDFPFYDVDEYGDLTRIDFLEPDDDNSADWVIGCPYSDGVIRGIPLSYFGAMPIYGAYDDIVTFGSIHGVWSEEMTKRDGSIAHGLPVQSSRDITLSLHLTAANIMHLWTNVDTLAYFLTRPGGHYLKTPLGRWNCYYSKMTAKDLINTTSGASVTITLTMIKY